MEIFAIFCGAILSLVIANAGAKRKIGYGWSLFLGIWLTPIVSLIAVLLSDKLPQNDKGEIEYNWGCIPPLILSILLIIAIFFFIFSIIG